MPNFTTSISIQTGKETLSATKSGSYNAIFSTTQIVDNADTFVGILSGSTGKGKATLSDCRGIIIKNSGISGAEIQFQSYTQTH